MRRFLTWAAIGLLFVENCEVAHARTSLATPSSEAIDALFKRYDKETTPGCSVAVIQSGKVTFKKSYGMADPALGVRMTSNTSSWIPYSEARVFVALAVGILAHEGKISLDAPVRRYVPEVPEYAHGVTIRNLIHHTSGLADYGVLAGPGFDIRDRLSEDEFFRMLSLWGQLGFEPGQDEMYSNTDYALLRILVERVSGKSLDGFLRERIFSPLGMVSTRMGFDQSQVVSRHALFHEFTATGAQKVLRYRVSPVGGISVTTSLDDLIVWDQALRENRLSIRTLLQPLEEGAAPAKADEETSGLLFGKYRRTYKGIPLVEYRGVGEFNYLVQAPSHDLSVATICNAYDDMWLFGPELAWMFAGSPTPQKDETRASTDRPIIPPGLPTITLPASELATFEGDYRAPGIGPVDVSLIDGSLVVTPSGRAAFPALRPIGMGLFETYVDDVQFIVAFKRDGDDVVMSSWDAPTGESGGPDLRRSIQAKVTAADLQSYSGVYVGDRVEATLYLRVENERLLLASSGFAEEEITPMAKRDEFRLPGSYVARFERNVSGEITGLVLDASRVKGVRYQRRR